MAQTPRPDLTYYARQAYTVFQAKDYPLYARRVRRLYALAPQHPGVVHGMAEAAILMGRKTVARRWLERLAALGDEPDIGADSTLPRSAPIRGSFGSA